MKPPPDDSYEGQVLALLPALRRYSQSLATSRADGEDLLQDCVEKLISRRSQWRGSNFRAWALTIMTNLYRNSVRSAPRHATVDLDAVEEASLIEELSLPDPLEHDRLVRALNSLSPDYRSVLMLVVVEGCTYKEVAEMLEVPLGTVMSRLSRARQRLSESMSNDNVITLRRPT